VDRSHNKYEVNEALEVMLCFFLCRGSHLGMTRSYFHFIHDEYPDLDMPEWVEVKAEAYMRKGKEE
jgi:hypothetical protein